MRMPPFLLHTPQTLDGVLTISNALADSGQEFDWDAGGTD